MMSLKKSLGAVVAVVASVVASTSASAARLCTYEELVQVEAAAGAQLAWVNAALRYLDNEGEWPGQPGGRRPGGHRFESELSGRPELDLLSREALVWYKDSVQDAKAEIARAKATFNDQNTAFGHVLAACGEFREAELAGGAGRGAASIPPVQQITAATFDNLVQTMKAYTAPLQCPF